MKRPHAIFISLLLMLSCNQTKTERGAIDTEILSKKTFDCIKENDYKRFSGELMPDRSIFTKILPEGSAQDKDSEKKKYDSLLVRGHADFDAVTKASIDWKDAKYMNTAETETKMGNISVADITTKFQSGTEIYKIALTADKVNNKWYYVSGLSLVAKNDSIPR